MTRWRKLIVMTAPLPSLLVRDLMTPEPLALGPGDDLAKLYDLMNSAHVRHVPVVDEGELVGIDAATVVSSTTEPFIHFDPVTLTTGGSFASIVVAGTSRFQIGVDWRFVPLHRPNESIAAARQSLDESRGLG